MIDERTIQAVAQRLVEVYNPREIYLFGSYAWGMPDEDSDLDLLIVVDACEKNERYQALVEGHRALVGMGIAKDLILLNKEEFEQYSHDPRRIFYKIRTQGKRIYARA